MNHEQQDAALMEAYRRASASDADRPGAATRAAILAEAAAAARRNAPAANESRYWLRAVAGIAVFGIGVVLWRQTDERLPVDVPIEVPVVASAPVVQAERTPSPPSVAKPENAATETAPVNEERAATEVVRELPSPEPFPASSESSRAVAAAEAPRSAAESLAPAQLARNDQENELAEVTVTGARIQAQRRQESAAVGAGGPAGAPRAGGSAPGGGRDGQAWPLDSTTALLRDYFPEQYLSDDPHSVWLVLNAAGEMLQSGELTPGQRLEDLLPRLTRMLGDRVPGPWQVQSLRNARGQPIELAIARLP